MKRLGVVLFALLAVVLGQSPSSAVALFTVSGTVTLPAGYDATTVSVARQNAAGTVTHQVVSPNASGAYTFTNIATGAYRLLFTGSGLQPGTLNVTVPLSDVTGADIALVRMVRISGTMASSNGPVTGATIALWDPACTTKHITVVPVFNGGSFQTPVAFPGGSYKMLVEPVPGQGMPTWYPVKDSCPTAPTLDLTADTTLNVTVSSGGVITGRVTVVGQPAAGQQVVAYREEPAGSGNWQVYGLPAVTGADGTYRLTSLASGTYKVKVPGWIGADVAPLEQWYPTPVSVSALQTVTGVDLDLVDGGRISGVTTGPQGPHSGSVNLHDAVTGNWIGGLSSGPDGKWTIMGLAPGTYKLRILDLDGSNLEYYDNVKTLSKAEVITIGPGTRVTGVDVWLGDGDPALVGATTRTLKRTPRKLKVGKTKVLAATTVEGEILSWKATTKTCQVKKAKKAWRVTGKREGVCRLRASVGSQWSANVSLRVR